MIPTFPVLTREVSILENAVLRLRMVYYIYIYIYYMLHLQIMVESGSFCLLDPDFFLGSYLTHIHFGMIKPEPENKICL